MSLEALLDLYDDGVMNRSELILTIVAKLSDAYEDGWYEATNGKWGPSEENPWKEL